MAYRLELDVGFNLDSFRGYCRRMRLRPYGAFGFKSNSYFPVAPSDMRVRIRRAISSAERKFVCLPVDAGVL
jgi:hypothetical protein